MKTAVEWLKMKLEDIQSQNPSVKLHRIEHISYDYVMSLLDYALKIEKEQMNLFKKDVEILAEGIISPPEPNEALKQAAKQYALKLHGHDEAWMPDRFSSMKDFVAGAEWMKKHYQNL